MEQGSFTQAAERLALTPSAISGHVKRLEEGIGVRLLRRTTRRVEATPAGDTLHAYARNIVALEREVVARLRGTQIEGRIRVGASEDFASTWLPKALHAFQLRHPDASIELRVGITADLLEQQSRGKLDVVFGKQCALADERGEMLWEEPLVWAYAERAEFDANGVVPLAVFPEPCVYREAALAGLSAGARRWRLAFESSSMAGCTSAALAGFAVTPLALSQLRPGLRQLGAEAQMPTLPNVRFYAFLHKRTPATHSLVKAVCDAGGWGM
nr:LysR family transcriptional regulator [Pandoraea anhela]